MDPATNQLELREELERFTTQFADRVTQATETLERSERAEVRDEAMRKQLLYISSALEIATGPAAVINLLDMIVLVRLCRSTLERHWIPQLYRAPGRELADVFARSDRELAQIAERTLSEGHRDQLDNLIATWLAENPQQLRVEGIRLADFAVAAGSAAADRALKVRGLLSSMKTATEAANQAMLLTERAMFLAHRLPFLWRLQARLGAREILGDAIAQVSHGPESPVQRLAVRARHVAFHALVAGGLLGIAVLFLRRRR
ncbi:MAG: hypothetical protein KF773_04995 [Deltaproteobacteria bacterium]|nr:hypothetical protein [Deltaproteobacteria bacterium]